MLILFQIKLDSKPVVTCLCDIRNVSLIRNYVTSNLRYCSGNNIITFKVVCKHSQQNTHTAKIWKLIKTSNKTRIHFTKTYLSSNFKDVF